MRTIRIIMRIFFITISIAVFLFSVFFPWFVVSEFIESNILLGILWILASLGGLFLALWIIHLWDKLDSYVDEKYSIYKRGLDAINEEKQLKLEAANTCPDDWSAAEVEVKRLAAKKAIDDFHETKEYWIEYTTGQRKYYREKREAVEGVVLDEREN